MNLKTDAENILKEELKRLGIKPHGDVVESFFYYQYRRISNERKNIFISDDFVCPKGYEDKFNKFCYEVKTGNNLLEYMSTFVKKSYHDYLFDDWRIYHFHLGEITNNCQVERSDFLIISFVRKTNFYLLKCIKHPRKNDTTTWCLIDYLNILAKNFPDAIADYCIGEQNYDKSFGKSPFIVNNLRSKNVFYPITLSNNKTYLFNQTGKVRVNKYRLFYDLKKIEEKIRVEPIFSLFKQINLVGFIFEKEYELLCDKLVIIFQKSECGFSYKIAGVVK